ncbi:hypothetical protein [Treponema sp. R80B11-R83G3]
MKQFVAFALFCIFSSLFSQAAYSQDFSSIDNDLQTVNATCLIPKFHSAVDKSAALDMG